MFTVKFTHAVKLILCFFYLVSDIQCIRIKELIIPNKVRTGDLIQLKCLYELEGENLYALSWTFNNKEFYRYVPRDRPQKQLYPLPYFKVDLARSHEGSIRVQMLNRTASGIYRCEIASENTFRTLNVQKHIAVESSSTNNLFINRNCLLIKLLLFIFIQSWFSFT